MNLRPEKPILAPSIISADYMNIKTTVDLLDKNKRCIMHVDVMDGIFVPNITIGMPVIKSIRKKTDICIDCHLMITNPNVYILDFVNAGANHISFHYEAVDSYCYQTLELIRNTGTKAGISISPDTPIEVLFDLVKLVDFVNIMSVYPGFSGQLFIKKTIEKIRKLDKLRTDINRAFMIQVDGGINMHNAGKLIEAGADILVAGNSVFKTQDNQKAINDLLYEMDATKSF